MFFFLNVVNNKDMKNCFFVFNYNFLGIKRGYLKFFCKVILYLEFFVSGIVIIF